MAEKTFEWTDELVKLFAAEWSSNKDGMICKFTKQFKEKYYKKEVVYPDGVLRFDNSRLSNVFSEGSFFANIGGKEYQKWMSANIKEGNAIHSIKNSSGEVLVIGDKIDAFSEAPIINFDIYDAGDKDFILRAYINHEGVSGWWNINKIHPVKMLLTEDGHELKVSEGKRYCGIVIDRKTFEVSNIDFPIDCFAAIDDILNAYYLFHSTANAEKFAEENRPRFSKKQIKDAQEKHSHYEIFNGLDFEEQLYGYMVIDTIKLGL